MFFEVFVLEPADAKDPLSKLQCSKVLGWFHSFVDQPILRVEGGRQI
jgi:hypothetical protein